jgi:hypothetical protein
MPYLFLQVKTFFTQKTFLLATIYKYLRSFANRIKVIQYRFISEVNMNSIFLYFKRSMQGLVLFKVRADEDHSRSMHGLVHFKYSLMEILHNNYQ